MGDIYHPPKVNVKNFFRFPQIKKEKVYSNVPTYSCLGGNLKNRFTPIKLYYIEHRTPPRYYFPRIDLG